MKGFSLLVFLSACSWALDALNLDSAKLSNLEQVLNGEITKFQRNGPVSEKDVTLYLYSSSKDGVVLTKDNLDEVDVSSTLVFIVHGWTASVNDSWVIKLRQSYLKKENYNVVEVDWSKPADKVYTISAGYVDDLGDYLGDLIAKLHNDYKADLKKIQVTGHSLGAQVGGATGRAVKNLTNSKIARITGLDPARPLFEDVELTGTGRLTKDDAELVVIVHSDAGVLGYLHAAGHIDFFPNGGTASQPGCEAEDATDFTGCSHGRSTEFFAEAIGNSKGFVSTKCSSYAKYRIKGCNDDKTVTMGADLTIDDSGKYYLQTNSESPYSKE